MRDYLYIWHDPDQQFLVASGIEFKDFQPSLNQQGGVLLVEHQSETAAFDVASGFSVAASARLLELVNEDIYSWGNFVWADYGTTNFSPITDVEVAELLFFARKARPLHGISLPNLHNDFLGYAHDDGWYLKLYYSSWEKIEQLLSTATPSAIGMLDLAELKQGRHGFWIRGGEMHNEEKTHDIDSVLNKRL